MGRATTALVTAVDERAQRRAGGLPLLRGRHDQRRRQLPGPVGRGPGHGRPQSADLGGRTRRRPHAHLRRAGRRVEPARRRTARPGRAQGRRRRGLHAQPGRGVHRDPRLQPHRRDLHGAVLRVRRGGGGLAAAVRAGLRRRRGRRELPARQAHPAAVEPARRAGEARRRCARSSSSTAPATPSRCRRASTPTPTCSRRGAARNARRAARPQRAVVPDLHQRHRVAAEGRGALVGGFLLGHLGQRALAGRLRPKATSTGWPPTSAG